MAQRTVQLIIGQILTDEEFRSDFLEQPIETLTSLRERGFELTNVEVERARPDRSPALGGWCGVDRRAPSALSTQWRRAEVTGEMAVKNLVFIFFVCVVAVPARALAQQSSESAPATEVPVLTLENAVSLATSHNRLVKDSVLEAEKYEFRVNVARSKRLPQFQFAVLGGQSLHAVDLHVSGRGVWHV